MRKLFLLLVLLTWGLTSKAGTLELVEGNVDCLQNIENLMIALDCSKATYLEKRDFKDFLKIARRIKNWEEESIDYFCECFNDKTKRVIAVHENNKDQYKLVVIVKNVERSGRITADIKIIDTKTGTTKAVFFLKGSDGDDDDEITLRDPMKDAGKTIGKYLRKTING